MAFTLSLWNLFETSILCLNAFTIINEERVFKTQNAEKVFESDDMDFEKCGTKISLYNLIHSMTAVSKHSILFLNLITIILKLLLGS